MLHSSSSLRKRIVKTVAASLAVLLVSSLVLLSDSRVHRDEKAKTGARRWLFETIVGYSVFEIEAHHPDRILQTITSPIRWAVGIDGAYKKFICSGRRGCVRKALDEENGRGSGYVQAIEH